MNRLNQASLSARMGAFMIDFLLSAMIQAFLYLPFIMIPLVQREISSPEIVSRNMWITLISFMYLVFRDVTKGRSIGKRALHLQVLSENAERASIAHLILRNIFTVIYPVEAIWLLVTSGRTRLGDIVARTGVYAISNERTA